MEAARIQKMTTVILSGSRAYDPGRPGLLPVPTRQQTNGVPAAEVPADDSDGAPAAVPSPVVSVSADTRGYHVHHIYHTSCIRSPWAWYPRLSHEVYPQMPVGITFVRRHVCVRGTEIGWIRTYACIHGASIVLPIYPSTRPYPSAYPIYLSIYLSNCPSVYPCACAPVRIQRDSAAR